MHGTNGESSINIYRLPWISQVTVVKNPPATAGDARGMGSRSPGGGNGIPIQYSCLGKSHGWRNVVGYSPWVAESDTTEQLPLVW